MAPTHLAPSTAGIGVLLPAVSIADRVPVVIAPAQRIPGGGAACVAAADAQHTGVRHGGKDHAAGA